MSDVKAGSAYVLIEARDKLSGALDAGSKKLEKFGQTIAGIGASLTAAGLSLGAPLAVSVNTFAKLGDELDKMSLRTGITVEALSGLRYAAEQSGASAEELGNGLKFLQKNLFAAAEGNDSAVAAFNALGLSVERLATLTPDQQFAEIAEALSRINDPTIRAGRAMDIFGKGAGALMPLLRSGKAGIAELVAEAERLGIVMSTEDATAAVVMGDTLDALSKTVRGVAVQIGAALAPAITDIGKAVAPLVKMFADWVRQNRGLVVAVAALSVGLIGAGGAFLAFGSASIAAGAALAAIKTAFIALASPIGLVAAGVTGTGIAILRFTKSGGDAIDWLGDRFREFLGTVNDVWTGAANAMAGGDFALAGEIATKGLEIVWLDFKGWLAGLFHDIGDGLALTWTQTVTGFSLALASGLANMTSLLNTFATAAKVVWTTIASSAARVWTVAKNATSNAVADFQLGADALAITAAKEAGNIDDDEAGRQMLEAVQRNRDTKTSAAQKAVEEINEIDKAAAAELSGAVQQFAANESATRAKLAEDQKAIMERSKAETQARTDANVAARDARLEEIGKLKDQLADLQEGAKQAAESVTKPGRPAIPELDAIPDSLSNIEKTNQQRIGGTFSAAVASRLAGGGGPGGGNPAERAAKAGEKLLPKIDELVRLFRNNPGLVFQE